MDKTADVFFEILLRNCNAILTEAQHQRGMQESRLSKLHSHDRTADAAIDNITGGKMTIDSNGQIKQLHNLQGWAAIIGKTKAYLKRQKNQTAWKVFQLAYVEHRNNRDAIKKVQISRAKYFFLKEEIKNLVRAAACEQGLWHALGKK